MKLGIDQIRTAGYSGIGLAVGTVVGVLIGRGMTEHQPIEPVISEPTYHEIDEPQFEVDPNAKVVITCPVESVATARPISKTVLAVGPYIVKNSGIVATCSLSNSQSFRPASVTTNVPGSSINLPGRQNVRERSTEITFPGDIDAYQVDVEEGARVSAECEVASRLVTTKSPENDTISTSCISSDGSHAPLYLVLTHGRPENFEIGTDSIRVLGDQSFENVEVIRSMQNLQK